MVSSKVEYKLGTPTYPLEMVQKLADPENIMPSGNLVNSDLNSHGYSSEEISRCIRCLAPTDFHESIKYVDAKSLQDVYLFNDPQRNMKVKLYIKLKLMDGHSNVYLHSFHPEGQ